jgi:hypothetical protein
LPFLPAFFPRPNVSPSTSYSKGRFRLICAAGVVANSLASAAFSPAEIPPRCPLHLDSGVGYCWRCRQRRARSCYRFLPSWPLVNPPRRPTRARAAKLGPVKKKCDSASRISCVPVSPLSYIPSSPIFYKPARIIWIVLTFHFFLSLSHSLKKVCR